MELLVCERPFFLGGGSGQQLIIQGVNVFFFKHQFSLLNSKENKILPPIVENHCNVAASGCIEMKLENRITVSLFSSKLYFLTALRNRHKLHLFLRAAMAERGKIIIKHIQVHSNCKLYCMRKQLILMKSIAEKYNILLQKKRGSHTQQTKCNFKCGKKKSSYELGMTHRLELVTTMAVSFQCMTKSTTNKKIKNQKIKKKRISDQRRQRFPYCPEGPSCFYSPQQR